MTALGILVGIGFAIAVWLQLRWSLRRARRMLQRWGVDTEVQPVRAAGERGSPLRDGSPEAAEIELHRAQWGWSDLLRSYHVVVDGYDIGEIRRGETRVFGVAPGRHEIHLVIDWARSRALTLDLHRGDMAKLRCRPNYRYFKRALQDSAHWIRLDLSP